MPYYRRAFKPGGTRFFTVNLLERMGNDLLVREIELLRSTIRKVKRKYPFHIDAWVVLPEHMHCVLTLPMQRRNAAPLFALEQESAASGDAIIGNTLSVMQRTTKNMLIMSISIP